MFSGSEVSISYIVTYVMYEGEVLVYSHSAIMPSSVLCVQSFLLFIIIDPKLEVFYGSSTTTAVKHIKVEGRSLNTKNTPAMGQGSL